MALIQDQPQDAHTVIGKVAQAAGTVIATGADGVLRTLLPGDPVFADDYVQTSDSANVVVALNGGGRLDLGRDSQALLDAEVYGADLAQLRADAVADAQSLSNLIAAGADPTQVGETTAAGETATDAGGEQTIAVVDRSGQEGIVENGFQTIGLQQTFPEPIHEPGYQTPNPITAGQNPPDAIDNRYALQEGGSANGHIIDDDTGAGTDSDPDGDTLSITHIDGNPVTFDASGKANITVGDGTLTIYTDGRFSYQHNGAEPTPTAFTYTITDGHGGSDTANVVLDIEPLPETPILDVSGPDKNFALFEDFQSADLGGASWARKDATDFNWQTDNSHGQIEVGQENLYGGSQPSNRVFELEGDAGHASNLFKELNTVKGEVYRLDFDHSARTGGGVGDGNASLQVKHDGNVVDTLNKGTAFGDSFGFNSHTYTFVTEAGVSRFELQATTNDSFGALLDNINLEFVGYTLDADIPFTINAGLAADDLGLAGTQLQVTLDDLSPGTTISDGVNSFTATAGSLSVDISSWDHNNLTANFGSAGEQELLITATTTDANGDQASNTQALNLTLLNADGSTSSASDISHTLNGTSGDDYLDGGDGADTLLGGDGDDVLVYDSIDTVIDGGAGNDTLQINGTVNGLSAGVSNIESVSMSDGSAGDELTLSLNDVLDATDSDNVLMIEGDTGDNVHLSSGDGWSASTAGPGDADYRDGYSLYESGTTQLYVDNEISVDIS